MKSVIFLIILTFIISSCAKTSVKDHNVHGKCLSNEYLKCLDISQKQCSSMLDKAHQYCDSWLKENPSEKCSNPEYSETFRVNCEIGRKAGCIINQMSQLSGKTTNESFQCHLSSK